MNFISSSILTWLAGSTYSVLLLLTWAGLFVSAYIFLEKKAQQEELLGHQKHRKGSPIATVVVSVKSALSV